MNLKPVVTACAILTFPFDNQMKSEVQIIGGTYLGKDKWGVALENEARAREAMIRCLGTDGIVIDQVDITLCVSPGTVIEEAAPFLHLLDWTIAHREYYKARPMDGVEFANGTLNSVRIASRNWRLVYRAPEHDHGRITLRGVARQRAESLAQELSSTGMIERCRAIANVEISPSTN